MADIVLLSVSGGVSGFGDAGAVSDLTSQYQSFTLSDSIGSGSATATAQGSFFGGYEDAFAEASATQGYNVSTNNISIDMQSSGDGSEQGVYLASITNAFADAQVSQDLSLEIELTSAYMVQLSGFMFVDCNPQLPFGDCGSQSLSAFNNDFGGPSLLTPGIYTVSASSSWFNTAFAGPFNPHEFDVNARLSFNADFTPIVPEPRWISWLVMPLAILISLVAARRRVLRRQE